ncbi:muellerian-inhibiting factor [Ascaphus truei]|uniref:muellerian-inhibiting factor n=1 Tax=Ascaphus truei TaxID=8439 RepID=UPI003F596433
MEKMRVGLLMLLPILAHALPSKVAESGHEWSRVEGWRPIPPAEGDFSKPGQHGRRQLGSEDWQGPLCRMKVGRGAGLGWSQLQTQGDLTDYESGFLDAVRRASWDGGDMELFGMCPEEEQPKALVALKRLASHLAEPEGKHFIIMHLENVEWEAGASLQFKTTVQEHIAPLLQHLQFLILVFYPGKHRPYLGHHGSKVLVTGEGLPQGQVLCMSPDTRFFVLRVGGTARSLGSGDLRFHMSVQIRGHPDGSTLSDAETQRLLFGTDDKCFSRITPALFMVVGRSGQAAISLPVLQSDELKSDSSSQGGLTVLPAGRKDEFLETLSHFTTLLLSSHRKETSSIHLPFDPRDDSIGDLHPQVLNITEVEALEWLVESEEPLVFLFMPGSLTLLGTQALQERLDGTLLEKVTKKLQEVMEGLEEVLSSRDHVQTLQLLLGSCYGSFNVSYLPVESEKMPLLGESQHRKLHSLMLLKALQTVRTYWQDRKKLSRQNRSGGVKPYCRLQELTINLKSDAVDSKTYLPEEININNCVGPCRFPQTTQSDYQSHVVLLNQLQERKQPGLARPPCCVPVRYQEQLLIVMEENRMKFQHYPNMVAKECGCR